MFPVELAAEGKGVGIRIGRLEPGPANAVSELGNIETPILLTDTLSVAAGIEGLLDYMLGYLNDIRGRHVRREHVVEAIRSARAGCCPEGCVGAGVGMLAYGYKAGIGTASRVIPPQAGGFTVGALVLANCGADGLPGDARERRYRPGLLHGEQVCARAGDAGRWMWRWKRGRMRRSW